MKKTKFKKHLTETNKPIWISEKTTEFDLFKHGLSFSEIQETEIQIEVDLDKYRKFNKVFSDAFSFEQFACERFFKMSEGGKKNREAKKTAGASGGKVKVSKGFAVTKLQTANNRNGGRKPIEVDESKPLTKTEIQRLAKRKSRERLAKPSKT